MQCKEAFKIQIASVHDVNGADLRKQQIQDIDLVDSAFGNGDKRRDVASQIQQRMEFNRSFRFTKIGPREHRKTKIDNGGVQRIDRFIQLNPEVFIGI